MSLLQLSYTQIKGAQIDVKSFGATGDGTTDDTVAIQAAIDEAGTGTGNTVYFPAGTYICSAPINMAKYVTLQGAGQIASTLKWNTTGIGIQMISPINSSTGVFNSINDLGLTCTNVSNTGGGYVDVGGSYINMTNVLIVGFKYGVILDQSELVDIDLCHFTLQTTGGVWLANANYTGGTVGDFTNRISIKRSQFNSSNVTTIGIIDDGGYSHVFEDNNYNECVNHIRLSGGKSVNIRGGEFESASSTSILMSSTTHTGSASGSSTNVLLDGCLLVPTAGNNCVTAVCQQLTIINCFFGNTASAKVTGLSTTSSFFEAGNSSGGGGALYSGTPTSNFQTTDYGSFTPVLTINNSSVGITGTFNGRYQKINQVVTFSIEIVLTSKGASAGNVVITGLPYSEATTIGQVVPVSLATGIVTATSIGAIVTGTTIALYNANVNFSAVLNNTNISDTTALYLSGSYFIS